MSERLARLAAKSQSWQTAAGAHGAITPSDIAASLAGGSRLGYAAALLAYAQHFDMRSIAERELWLRVVDLAARERWQIQPGMLRLLTKLAVFEAEHPARCYRCGGRGEMRLDGKVFRCEECIGTGRGRASERQLADAAGVPKTTWRRTWAPKYRKASAVILEAMGETIGRSRFLLR